MLKFKPMIAVTPGSEFAAEVEGMDFSQPFDQEQIIAIKEGMARFAVLIFRGQTLTDDQQLSFSRSFGDLEQSIKSSLDKTKPLRVAPEIADISNLDINNRVQASDDRARFFSMGNQLWHSDSSFKPVPASYSILSGRDVPNRGGNTEFADMRAAYDTLDDDLKKEAEDLICKHSLIYSRSLLGFDDFTDKEREAFQPVCQPLVRTNPVTERKSLFLSSHAGEIIGWPTPEARAFLRDLMEHATQRKFVYAHKWCNNDLVMWDNATTMHRGRRFDSKSVIRDLRRTTIVGVNQMQTKRGGRLVKATPNR